MLAFLPVGVGLEQCRAERPIPQIAPSGVRCDRVEHRGRWVEVHVCHPSRQHRLTMLGPLHPDAPAATLLVDRQQAVGGAHRTTVVRLVSAFVTASNGVDQYLERTDAWPDEIAALRPILLACGLDEEIKWAKPCYGHAGDNIVIMQEMKDVLAMMFFKGALLSDPAGVLESQGPNSRSARRLCFRSVDDVTRLADTVTAYVEEAKAISEAGLAVGPAPELELAAELQARLDADPALRSAFEALTPGRQREYQLHISAAKQSSTRASHVEKFIPKILAGKGFRDR